MAQLKQAPVLVVCEQCGWVGAIEDCHKHAVALLAPDGKTLDWEYEPVCPNCGCPNLN